ELFSRKVFLSYLLAFSIPALWLFTTADPYRYLTTLFWESLSRVSNEGAFYLRPIRLLLLTLKDTLPTSLFLLASLFMAFKNKSMNMTKNLVAITLVLLANFAPYLLSNSAGRYVLPIYPFFALVSAHFINSCQKIRKAFLITLLITIFLRSAFGLLFFPYYTERETSRKRIAMDIMKTVDLSRPIACNCSSELSICLYLGIAKGEPLRKIELTPKAEYVVDCSHHKANGFIKKYSLSRDYDVYLLKVR
ncbi:MAG: glycosyl transferase, partial [Aquificaceae bacterium]